MAKGIVIDAEFEGLMPKLSDGEREKLRESLIRDGCLCPLIVWHETGILLDGHNRYHVCNEFNIPYQTETVNLADRYEAEAWILDHQLGRRNLTDKQRTDYLGMRYELEKRREGRPEKRGQFDHVSAERTAEKLAKENGVSPKTVIRAAEFHRGLESMTKNQRETVMNEESSATKADVAAVGKIEDPAERKRAAKSVAEGKGLPKPEKDDRPRDATGQVIESKKAAEAFADYAEFTKGAILHHANGLASALREVVEDRDVHPAASMWAAFATEWQGVLRSIIYKIKGNSPYAITPADMAGDGKATAEAKRRGWISKEQHEALTKRS